jgi:hypothetical protein
MRMTVVILALALVGSVHAAEKVDYTGFWKVNCSNTHGVQIKPAQGQLYSVSFCGPGGCTEPGQWAPNTTLEGDPKYQVVSATRLRMNKDDNDIYVRCTNDPTWVVQKSSEKEPQNQRASPRAAALGQQSAEKRRRSLRKRLAKLTSAEKPPRHYVAVGECPFECCQYGQWQVRSDTQLFDRPNGTVAVAKALRAMTVLAITGEVHLEPAPAAILVDHPPFKKGDIVFALDYMGEGLFRYWYKGRAWPDGFAADDSCPLPGDECWAEYINGKSPENNQIWWIQIRLPDGTTGWTDQGGNFDGKDSCA